MHLTPEGAGAVGKPTMRGEKCLRPDYISSIGQKLKAQIYGSGLAFYTSGFLFCSHSPEWKHLRSPCGYINKGVPSLPYLFSSPVQFPSMPDQHTK